MAEPIKEPLGETDLEEIKRRLEDLEQADRVIDRAVRAGIPMQEQQKKARELREQLMKIKGSFFPGR